MMDALIIFGANYLIVFVVAGLVLTWWLVDRSKKVEFVAVTFVACGIAFVLSRIAGHLYYDPRPFVLEQVKPLISHAADNGFPSDHALLTMTLTGVVYFYHKKIAGVLAVMTILVGFARVLALVHSPLDILAGWAIGIISAMTAYVVVRQFYERYHHIDSTLKSDH